MRHQPNRFQNYFKTHETVLEQFKSRRFVGNDTLEFRPSNCCFLLDGEIGCLGGLVIRVEKLIRIVSQDPQEPLVQTEWYAYNASLRNNHNIFRYDNQDEDFNFRLGHADPHHKHTFDWCTGNELSESPLWVGAEKWPTLGDVLHELEDWYWKHKELLSNPEDYPELDLR